MHLPVQKVQSMVSFSSACEKRTYVHNTRAGEIKPFPELYSWSPRL